MGGAEGGAAVAAPAPTTPVRPRAAATIASFAVRLRADAALIVFDAVAVTVAFLLALVLRFDGRVPRTFWHNFAYFVPVTVLAVLVANACCQVYGQIWRHASAREARRLVTAGLFACAAVVIFDGTDRHRIPLSVVALGMMSYLLAAGGLRFRERLFGPGLPRAADRATPQGVRVVVVGAGEAAAALVRDLRRSAERSGAAPVPVALLDDNPRLRGHTIHGVRVVGSIRDLPAIVAAHHASQVILAIPSAPRDVVRTVADLAEQADVPLRVLPGVAELVQSRVTARSVRDVRIEDLLGRQAIPTDLDSVRELIAGRRVLVTGAGGSIGSEIARQVAQCDPELLVVLDHDETHLHDLVAGLPRGCTSVLADVRSARAIDAVFEEFRPQLVFHAAAHKHVPILERHPCEAAHTNVLGTQVVADAAARCGVDRFVYISTDKAVEPRSVMGASKRIGEQVVLGRGELSGGSRFCGVRFGNVLGSRGSVIPTFVRQIENGGPVTITDPRMTRFFMSIPEAVQLVLQAAAFAEGGELFMLEMGEPVRIYDLAERMIRLSGARPNVDIPIEVVGMREGEKLHEELRTPEEAPLPTPHPSIVRLRPRILGYPVLADAMTRLALLVEMGQDDAARTALFETVSAITADPDQVDLSDIELGDLDASTIDASTIDLRDPDGSDPGDASGRVPVDVVDRRNVIDLRDRTGGADLPTRGRRAWITSST